MENDSVKNTYEFENAAHFENIVRNIEGYVYSVIYEGGKVAASYHSPQCKQITGYTSEEYKHNPLLWIGMVHPEDRQRVVDLFENSTGKTKQKHIEHRIIHKDGTIHWVSNRFTEQFTNEGVIKRRDGIVIDISANKETVMSFYDSVERYKALVENSYDLIYEIGRDLTILFAGRGFKQTLGYAPDELIQKKYIDYVHPSDREAVLAEMRKSQGQIAHRLKHKNGEWLLFESSGKEYYTAEGERRGVIVSRDISYRKSLEQKLIRSEKMIAVGEMSAMIAHETRNALTSIKMIMQLLQESRRITKSEKNSIFVALQSIYHLESVMKQLLSFAHPVAIKPAPENVNKLITECISFLDIHAKKKDILVSTKLEDGIPLLQLHAPTFKESLINIFLNATQAFEGAIPKARRRIVISTERITLQDDIVNRALSTDNEYFQVSDGEAPEADITLLAGMECVLIKITDNGKGISNSYLKHIFEPFFSTKEKGSGLGLSIAKKSINAHGGVVVVISQEGKGTSFKIYLPLGADENT
jgi:two-component system, sporulation sensor kinase A